MAEEFKNTNSHGGFEKGGGSLYFHLPGIGAIPARLSDARGDPSLTFLFEPEPGTDSIWQLFDEVDAWLRSRDLRFAMRFIESGLDVAFDAESVAEFQEATVSDEVFDNYLEASSYEADQAVNMDW